MERDPIDTEYADSAVVMNTEASSTTVHDLALSECEAITKMPEGSTGQTLSDKMRQLAAVAWTLEQDDGMSASRMEKVQQTLAALERLLEVEDHNRGVEHADEDEAVKERERSHSPTDRSIDDETTRSESDEWMEEQDLINVRFGIAAALTAMRLRHEEQAHLHELTVSKIEGVAQRCIAQEQEMKALLSQLRLARSENDVLHTEKAQLCSHVAELQSVFAQKEIAVSAMSSAVKGLEGWIDTARPIDDHVSMPPPSSEKRKRMVTRGKGRFRGRYVVDEGNNSWDELQSGDQEIHDGVRAWLRGFRDVEEELQQHHLQNRGRTRTTHQPVTSLEDDWGDFEVPARHG